MKRWRFWCGNWLTVTDCVCVSQYLSVANANSGETKEGSWIFHNIFDIYFSHSFSFSYWKFRYFWHSCRINAIKYTRSYILETISITTFNRFSLFHSVLLIFLIFWRPLHNFIADFNKPNLVSDSASCVGIYQKIRNHIILICCGQNSETIIYFGAEMQAKNATFWLYNRRKVTLECAWLRFHAKCSIYTFDVFRELCFGLFLFINALWRSMSTFICIHTN